MEYRRGRITQKYRREGRLATSACFGLPVVGRLCESAIPLRISPLRRSGLQAAGSECDYFNRPSSLDPLTVVVVLLGMASNRSIHPFSMYLQFPIRSSLSP